MKKRFYTTAVIAQGASLSAAVELNGYDLVAIQMPVEWTAANLTFQGTVTPGGSYQNMYDDAGTEIAVTAAGERTIMLNTVTKRLAGLLNIKIRSGTAVTAVNQAQARTLTLVFSDRN